MNTIQRLNSIAVRGYRSIEDMQLELRPLNVLIGTNGAGRGNLISMVKMMMNYRPVQISEPNFHIT